MTECNCKDSITSLREFVKIQCSSGNWNYDPYMHGMANGLILALSLFESRDKMVQFLDPPETWLKDTITHHELTTQENESD